MTDIEFDQIRPGQTIRLHCKGGFTVEGPVLRVWVGAGNSDPLSAVQVGDTEGANSTARWLVARVELLAEPDPGWRVGQLAEIDWSSSGCAGATRKWLARWDGSAWHILGEGALVYPDRCGEPRLLTAVPADARIVAQEAVVLPPSFPELQPSAIRSNADYINRCCNHPASVRTLLSLAAAIEESQS